MYHLSNYISFRQINNKHQAMDSELEDVCIPNNIHEALQNHKWKKAIE